MYIPKAMRKENDFLDVAIPKNSSYFQRIGNVTVPETNYSGDDNLPLYQDKIQQIEDYQKFAESEAQKFNSKND